ncbi:MAG: alpha/beta hydrolase [Bacteroidales bacterium]|nr:alpha/beta hydrolase [Bacteroidales bacterium]
MILKIVGNKKVIFIFLILLIASGCQSQKGLSEKLPLPYPNSRFSESSGVLIHYRIWTVAQDRRKGSVLFLHGFSGSTFSWEKAVPALQAEGFEVVALDIPPFGFSDKSPKVNASVTARAALLLQWLDENFPAREWHLVGHSMGAGVVQAMALMQPEKTASVVFVAGAIFNQLKPSERQSNSLLRFRPVQAFVGNLAETHFISRRRIAQLLESAYGSKPEQEAIEAYYRALKIPGTARAVLAGSNSSMEIASLNAADLQLPVLAIWGENDTWVPLASRQNVLDRMPNVMLKIIENAGHNPMETHPEAFNKYLLDFLLQIKEQ